MAANESILAHVLDGSYTLSQALVAGEAWLGQTETTVAKAIQSDPAVSAAVNTVIADGKAALTAAAGWADTASAGDLAKLAAEISAVVAKYVPVIAGVVGGPSAAALTSGAITLIGAVSDVATAAVQHEIAAITTGTSTVTPAA